VFAVAFAFSVVRAACFFSTISGCLFAMLAVALLFTVVSAPGFLTFCLFAFRMIVGRSPTTATGGEFVMCDGCTSGQKQGNQSDC